MAKLLYIEASPRKDRSHSIKVAQTFMDAYKTANPNDEIETLDLWSVNLPSFDGDTINAKYAILHGESHTDKEADAWEAVVNQAEHFKSADKYLLSVPMWNFGIPYKLKHYIDVITQPGLTFSFSPDAGYQGLVTDKPVTVILSRGGEYAAGSATEAYDLQKPSVMGWLGFIGFTTINSIDIEPTLAAPDAVESVIGESSNKAAEIAAGF